MKSYIETSFMAITVTAYHTAQSLKQTKEVAESVSFTQTFPEL